MADSIKYGKIENKFPRSKLTRFQYAVMFCMMQASEYFNLIYRYRLSSIDCRKVLNGADKYSGEVTVDLLT